MLFWSKNLSRVLIFACLSLIPTISQSEAPAEELTMGNGEHNAIQVTQAQRDDNVLTFRQVKIAGNGWLVIHPFEEGKPNGDKYVGATFVPKGVSQDVSVEVYKGIATGEHFIVMLHEDSNNNGIFDFVFIDDRNVLDRAVFEGTKMIGHVFSAP